MTPSPDSLTEERDGLAMALARSADDATYWQGYREMADAALEYLSRRALPAPSGEMPREAMTELLAKVPLPHHYALSREEPARRLWDEDDMRWFAFDAMAKVRAVMQTAALRPSAYPQNEGPGTPAWRIRKIGEYAISKGLCSGLEAIAPETFLLEAFEKLSAYPQGDESAMEIALDTMARTLDQWMTFDRAQRNKEGLDTTDDAHIMGPTTWPSYGMLRNWITALRQAQRVSRIAAPERIKAQGGTP